MVTAISAGLAVIRQRVELEVFLVHPGGPFWANKDEHAWSIPKGLCAEDEDPQSAAAREFREETGFVVPEGPWYELGSFRASNKVIVAWAVVGDLDPTAVVSNTFTMIWPPKSSTTQTFPEVDKAGWFALSTARRQLHKGQAPLVDRLGALAIAGDARGDS